MDDNEMNFAEFLSARMKDRGVSVKRLSETTGIASTHIEAMLRGDFEELPAAPYLRGYLMRIGKALGFDGEEWWQKVKVGHAGTTVTHSGPTDALPQNRFVQKDVPKWVWLAVIAGILIVAYLAFALPRILGKPLLAVTDPPSSPFVATSTTFTFRGTVRDADTLYLSDGSASSSEEIAVAPDGTWQKTALLQKGLNPFIITAKKFLGGSVNITEQVIYEPEPTSTAAPAAASSSTGASSGF